MKLIDKIWRRIRPDKFLDIISAHELFVNKYGKQRGSYLEFGSYRGGSALAFYRALMVYYEGKIPPNAFFMYLFDSFAGLPDSDDAKDMHPAWKKGEFNVGGVQSFINLVMDEGLPKSRFQCVDGYYEQSLEKFQMPDGEKVAIVNMDCDYYSSTKLALDFLRPYLQNFTLLYFDDLLAFSGNPNKGQLAAISEFNAENPNMGIGPCPLMNGRYEGRVFWAWVS